MNGKRVTQARELRGWTVEDLAAAVNVQPMEVLAWEWGMLEPSPELLEQVAGATGFPQAFFFREDPPELGESTLDLHLRTTS